MRIETVWIGGKEPSCDPKKDNEAGVALMAGFLALLLLDWYFSRAGVTPPWWMHLRLILTAVVLACLFVTVTA